MESTLIAGRESECCLPMQISSCCFSPYPVIVNTYLKVQIDCPEVLLLKHLVDDRTKLIQDMIEGLVGEHVSDTVAVNVCPAMR